MRSQTTRTAAVARRSDPSCALILLYHRIADLPTDTFEIVVSPENFAAHLAVLQRTCHVMPLLDLIRAVRAGDAPHRAVALTFDDGYADNATCAVPLLRQHGTPATLFIVTGVLGSRDEFWWDVLERLLVDGHDTPPHLQLAFGDRTRAWPTRTAAERRAAVLDIHALVKPSPSLRGEILAQVRAWVGSPIDDTSRPAYLPMTIEQAIELARDDLIDLGAHSVSHPELPALSRGQQRVEIAESCRFIQQLTGAPLAFAYPFGDLDDATVALVRNSPARAAVTIVERATRADDDPFLLPRCDVKDWDAATFASQLDRWFADDHSPSQ